MNTRSISYDVAVQLLRGPGGHVLTVTFVSSGRGREFLITGKNGGRVTEAVGSRLLADPRIRPCDPGLLPNCAQTFGEPNSIEDYLRGDPYRRFAKASLGILNPTEQQRQIYKAIVLGRIYGQGGAHSPATSEYQGCRLNASWIRRLHVIPY